jgi:peroxiredoxin
MNCKTKYCTNQAVKHRKLCAKCRSRKYKREHPFKYFYNVHRQNAKKRNIPWELTFEEFKEIWEESGKWNEKRFNTELSKTTWTLDRKNVNKGYTKNNVRVVSMMLNVEVWWEEDRWQIDFNWRKRWSEIHHKPIDDCPF